MKNSLLQQTELPLFAQIKPEHALPAITAQLAENRKSLEKLLQKKQFTWENLMFPLQSQSAKLSNLWSPVSHLNAVMNTPEWREAYNLCLPLLTEYYTEIGQNKALYEAIKSINEPLNAVQQKIIHDHLRDFHLSGITLEGEAKERFAAIQQRLSEVCTKFEEHILDATQAWHYHVTDAKMLAGLPELSVAQAKQLAEEKKVPLAVMGKVGGKRLIIGRWIGMPVDALNTAWREGLRRVM